MKVTLAIDTATARTQFAILKGDELLWQLTEDGATTHGDVLAKFGASAAKCLRTSPRSTHRERKTNANDLRNARTRIPSRYRRSSRDSERVQHGLRLREKRHDIPRGRCLSSAIPTHSRPMGARRHAITDTHATDSRYS